MARRNPYAMDPALMQGVSNLTRALIGSATDDASLARARASDAAAGKYNAETAYLDGKTNYLENNNAAIADALGDSRLVSSLFSLTGLNSGNLPTNPTGKTGPFIGNEPATSMPPGVSENAMRGLVRSLYFGGVPGNPQQSAASAQTLANMNNQQEAYKLLSESGQSPDRQAAIRLGQTLTQYFDPGVAQRGQDVAANTSITNNKADNLTTQRGQDVTAVTNRRGQDIDSTDRRRGQDIDSTDLRRGQDIDSSDKRRGQDIDSTDLRRGQDIDSTDKRRGQDIDDKTTRWKHENRTISMTVEPGKQIVVDAATGKKLGIRPTMVTDGGETVEKYILDGGEAAGKIKVSVPQGGTVFMDKPTADALGIKPDANGNYKVQGQPKTSTSAANDKRKRPAMDKINQSYSDDVGTVDGWEDIPNAVRAKVKGTLLGYLNKGMKDNQDMDYTTAFTTAVSAPIRQGVIQIDTGIGDGLSDFAVPAYFYNSMSTAANFQALGFSKKQAEAIVKQKSGNQ